MQVHKINHLGIAVADLDSAVQVYERLGLTVNQVIQVPEQKVRVAFVAVGESTIELVQPTSPDSTVARYLEQKGEGLHHLALEVEDIGAALAELKAQGVRLVDERPRRGAEGQIAFLHPKSTGRVLIELVEPE
jgi:methylmalonyl-CoA/ethylmalonyl-CoA epimerase